VSTLQKAVQEFRKKTKQEALAELKELLKKK